MNEFGEPNMGNPSVRFDEGRSGIAGLTTAVSSNTASFHFAYSTIFLNLNAVHFITWLELRSRSRYLAPLLGSAFLNPDPII